MKQKFDVSVKMSLRSLKGKAFKATADTIRSGISNEHGFAANKGVTDERLKKWPIVIRFATIENRTRFLDTMNQVLHPQLVARLDFQPLRPTPEVEKPYRWISNH